MKLFLLLFCLFPIHFGFAQFHKKLKEIHPDAAYENVSVKKIAEDSLQSTFLIWIKKDVRGHFHQYHTENIIVLEGKAEMMFNGERIIVRKGDYLNIPKGTHHSVERVISRKPLKVLSIQSPNFDGKDRIFIQQ